MLPAVSEVAVRFTKALSLFGKCHNGYNSGILADEYGTPNATKVVYDADGGPSRIQHAKREFGIA